MPSNPSTKKWWGHYLQTFASAAETSAIGCGVVGIALGSLITVGVSVGLFIASVVAGVVLDVLWWRFVDED